MPQVTGIRPSSVDVNLLPGWPRDRSTLAELGRRRVVEFCQLNSLPRPTVTVVAEKWRVDSCGYYRKAGINVCLPLCGTPCTEAQSRNWTWPGSVTDREPYGVICHELGHHCDWLAGKEQGSYGSEISRELKKESGEPAITSYCPNSAEWFAEMFRVFVTNPDLLSQVRPRTYKLFLIRWKPLPSQGWRHVLGSNVPERVVRSLRNKGAR